MPFGWTDPDSSRAERQDQGHYAPDCPSSRPQASAAEAVLAVTFTNKALRDARAGHAASGSYGGASKPWLSTFHSFSVRLLRRDGATLADLRPGFSPRFTIYDEEDQRP